MIEPTVFITFAYLLGAFPTAYILGKLFYGKDITQLGNRNVGTVNAWREFGWKTGIAVLIIDMMKGAIVMALILILGANEMIAFAAAIAVTLGHNFSVFLKFEGGKGAAVVLGLSLVILPMLTILAMLTIPIVYRFTRSVVWSFLTSIIILNLLIILTGQPASQVGLCITLGLVVIATHIWRTRKDFIVAIRALDFARFGQVE